MSMKLYVGNLSYSTTDADLNRLFSESGTVESATVITDRDTGRSKGFGFVEMASREEGEAAIKALNGTEIGGRSLTVNEARPREERSGGFGGGGGSRGGGGGRGGYGGGSYGGGGGRGGY
ncbi:MAG TPA: RNA-binding protein [Candidatus Kapabacteria bacterium]|jgi:RNA recognition motif-containing protein|nr:RNA-binding protein [Candidatus Kapabacteria bacterium]